LEESPYEIGMGTADENFDAAAIFANLDDQATDAVTRCEVLSADAIIAAEIGFDAAEVYDERLSFEALHLAVDELADAGFVLFVKDIALRFAYALEEALLDGLGYDPPELVQVELVDLLTVFHMDLACLAVDTDDEVIIQAQATPNTL
jgi:hypothetical protein